MLNKVVICRKTNSACFLLYVKSDMNVPCMCFTCVYLYRVQHRKGTMRIKEEILKEKRRQRNSRDMNVEWWQLG